MTPELLKELRKETQRAKRLAAEQAAALHDLVEERLPAAYAELPALAQATYGACQTWAACQARLEAAEAAATAIV